LASWSPLHILEGGRISLGKGVFGIFDQDVASGLQGTEFSINLVPVGTMSERRPVKGVVVVSSSSSTAIRSHSRWYRRLMPSIF
jgi:hypothetical protein